MLNVWTRPCLPGCEVRAAAAAKVASPMPFADAKTARRTPHATAAPAMPPRTGSRPNAEFTMSLIASGTLSQVREDHGQREHEVPDRKSRDESG